MSTTFLSKRKNKSQNDTNSEELKPWIRRFGRFGHMVKGTVYGLVGVLSFMAAIGAGGETTGTGGMFRSLAAQPFGEIILWIIGIGLIGYITWVIIKSIYDTSNKGRDLKGLITRTGYLIGGVIYGGLASNAFQIAMHAGSSGNSEQTISSMLLGQPFGPWLVGLIGLIIIGYGGTELYSGVTNNFLKKFNHHEMNEHERKIAKQSGKMGLISRGIVLATIGFFFVQTGLTSNPDESKGLDGALAEVAQQPFGQWMLGFVALGFILYGIYEITRGRYERMSFGK
ncbi:hypothetical protein GCM10010954_09200 [Halobacillus andaensis]|uniref:DUF1206 domain-containing protein n=1 Tax=Halobacillus andaensis TaxID=1176239 RepID=A0A917ETA1_HALAA|nr:DUF1206 domain-containing protein [Halobacillus andaensis]MBP2003710.1 hypothetical protein [Halobacillus andaensis]GGF12630.1 hypothetical protein GCM10010954_09200 [Halobacillus andaensis]